MFDNLSERLGRTIKNLRGQGRLSEENVKDTLREVRMALLEADVALPVVKQLVDSVRDKAMGQEVIGSLSPGQAFIKVVNDELVSIMGDNAEHGRRKRQRKVQDDMFLPSQRTVPPSRTAARRIQRRRP